MKGGNKKMNISRSHSSDIKEPSRLSGREIIPENYTSEPLYSRWYHQALTNSAERCLTKRSTFIPPQKSSIYRCIVAFTKPSMQRRVTTEAGTQIHFWKDFGTMGNDVNEDICGVIKTQFMVFASPHFIIPLVSQSAQVIERHFRSSKKRKENQRLIFHYISHNVLLPNPPPERDLLYFPDPSNSENDCLSMEKLFESSGNPAIFIFDRDYAGALFNAFVKCISARQQEGKELDIIGFFSCDEKQKMPRSTNLPIDIFTACLTTPARIALSWHSRRYFCFKTGPLHPLSTYFYEEFCTSKEEEERINRLLTDINTNLRSTVETMAFQAMDHQLFLKLFRSDIVLTNITINFFLAQRVLSDFNINPLSYPTLPNLSDNLEWHTFDLRLDETLYLLTNKSIGINNDLSFHSFLEESLSSMEHTVELGGNDSFQFELSYFSLILKEDSLSERACKVLAKYLDQSTKAIDNSLYFPIAQTLFYLLKKNVTPEILFCLIKMLSFTLEIRGSLFDKAGDIIENTIIPLIERDYNKLLIIFLTLLVKDSTSSNFRQLFLNNNSVSCLNPSTFDNHDSQIWALHFISCCAPNIQDTNLCDQLISSAMQMAKSDSKEVQLCVVHTLAGFIFDSMVRQPITRNNSKNLMKQRNKREKKVTENALRFKDSTSQLIRKELLLLISRFLSSRITKYKEKHNDKPLYMSIYKFIQQCTQDPYPQIVEIAETLINAIKNEQDVCQKSYLLDVYIEAFCHPIIGILENPEKMITEIINTNNAKAVVEPLKNEPKGGRIRSGTIRNIPCKFAKIKPMIIYKHSTTITSELINLPSSSKIVFGDRLGNVCIKSWDDDKIEKVVKVAKQPISCFKYLENCGSPLLFTGTKDGCCYACKFENSMKLVSTFRVINEPGRVHIEIDHWTNVLYSYIPRVTDTFCARDLRADKILNDFKPSAGKACKLQCLDKYSDYIALCGTTDKFELYDLRASYSEPVIPVELNSPAFDFSIIDPLIPSFAVALDGSVAGLLDLRHPAPRYHNVFFKSETSDTSPYAFAVQPQALTVALAHEEGITNIDLNNGNRELVGSIPGSFSPYRIPKTTSMLFHESRFWLTFVNDNQNIITGKNEK